MGHVERAQTDCSLAATGARHARRRLSRPVERPLIGTFGSHALCPFTQVPENLKSRLLLAGPTPCVRHFTGDVSWMEISSRYSRAMSERPMLPCIWVSQPARLKSIVAMGRARPFPSSVGASSKIGRAHAGTPVTTAHLVCRLRYE